MLHVGGMRTALFGWLLAKQQGGQFVLRFEDTDKKREVAGARQHLIDSLHALGLDYDEGPDIGGPYGPYTQSERLDHYRQWAQKLIDDGRAYADPYTPEEVQAFRERAQAAKQPFLYRNHRPENPPAWDGTMPLRFKSDPKPYQRTDAVMGKLQTGPEVIDDFVLIKSDGYPTYNFAHIIDDHEMKITHIIRGQEFLASVPNYLNLYEALRIKPPVIASVPHILGPDGRKKLSKRDGAKDILDYTRDGYLPEALRNFIASMGWNDGTEQELFTTEELIQAFSLDHVQRSAATFDERRLQWMNGHLIRDMDIDELYARTDGYWPQSAASASDSYKKSVLSLLQERLKYLAEIPSQSEFFFTDLPIDPTLISENKQLKKIDRTELKALLLTASDILESSDFTKERLTNELNTLLVATEQKPGVLFSLLRVATTQAPFSPPLAGTMSVLGRETCLRRINELLDVL